MDGREGQAIQLDRTKKKLKKKKYIDEKMDGGDE